MKRLRNERHPVSSHGADTRRPGSCLRDRQLKQAASPPVPSPTSRSVCAGCNGGRSVARLVARTRFDTTAHACETDNDSSENDLRACDKPMTQRGKSAWIIASVVAGFLAFLGLCGAFVVRAAPVLARLDLVGGTYFAVLVLIFLVAALVLFGLLESAASLSGVSLPGRLQVSGPAALFVATMLIGRADGPDLRPDRLSNQQPIPLVKQRPQRDSNRKWNRIVSPI